MKIFTAKTKFSFWLFFQVEGNAERFESQGQQSKQRLNSSSYTPSAAISVSAGRVGVEGGVACDNSETNGDQFHDFGHLGHRRGPPESQEALTWSRRNTPVVDPRGRLINGAKSRFDHVPSTITDRTSHANKEDVMEPEHKEEIDHESSTPSPEVVQRNPQFIQFYIRSFPLFQNSPFSLVIEEILDNQNFSVFSKSWKFQFVGRIYYLDWWSIDFFSFCFDVLDCRVWKISGFRNFIEIWGILGLSFKASRFVDSGRYFYFGTCTPHMPGWVVFVCV